MSFTDHKITAFAHKIADLPDEPQIPAAELKSRFDACPEELRQSLNAVCDDAARLEARVEGIVVDTFGDTIDKEMLSDELAAELDGKATQSALDSTADALDERLDAVEAALPEKTECYFGTYVGDDESSKFISLGFTPKVLLVFTSTGYTYSNLNYYGGLAIQNQPCQYTNYPILTIEEGGFRVYCSEPSSSRQILSNCSTITYLYVALL